MVDLIIVVGFLLFVLAVGIYKGRGIKTMVQYSVGNRNFPTSVLVATIFATLVGGGSTIGLAEKVYVWGLVFLLTNIGMPINKLIIAKFIAPHMNRFKKMITVGDMMASFYGKNAKVITGIAGTCVTIGYVGAQIIALGYMSQMLMDIPYEWGVIFGASIVVIYSAFGGVESVTATDVIQFAVLIIAIPTVCGIGLQKVGGVAELFARLPESHKTVFVDTHSTVKHIGLFLFWCIPFLDPSFVQRLLMAKDNRQIVNSMYASALTSLPFFIMVGLTGMVALVLYPEINPNLALPTLITDILPVGFKGFVIAGMFSVIMSTADSDLNASSITFVHDVVQPIRRVPLTDRQELFLSKIVTIVAGSSAILAALFYKNVIDLVLVAASFWAPVVLAPLILGIFGYKARNKAFLISVFCGLTTLFVCNLFLKPYIGIDGLIPSIVVNGTILYFMAYKDRPEKRSGIA